MAAATQTVNEGTRVHIHYPYMQALSKEANCGRHFTHMMGGFAQAMLINTPVWDVRRTSTLSHTACDGLGANDCPTASAAQPPFLPPSASSKRGTSDDVPLFGSFQREPTSMLALRMRSENHLISHLQQQALLPCRSIPPGSISKILRFSTH